MENKKSVTIRSKLKNSNTFYFIEILHQVLNKGYSSTFILLTFCILR